MAGAAAIAGPTAASRGERDADLRRVTGAGHDQPQP